MRYQRHSRPAFTIVEMMVATALILVIMLIISQAFASASKTFRTIRAAGDMQAQLREGVTTARRDLAADHFGSPYGSARGGPRVSISPRSVSLCRRSVSRPPILNRLPSCTASSSIARANGA